MDLGQNYIMLHFLCLSQDKIKLYNALMTIYIESFIIQNALINISLLRLISISLKPRGNLIRLIISASIGAIFSVMASIYLNNVVILNLIKLICAISMLLIAFRQNFKQFTLSMLLLLVFTYTFGGLIMNLGNIEATTNYGVVMSSKISLEMICAIIIISSFVYEALIKHLKFKIKTNNLIYKATLHLGNKHIKLNAYLDTGNFLNLDGKPILIVDIDTYCKLTNKSLIDFYLDTSPSISTSTVTGTQNLKLLQIERLELKHNKEIKIYNNQYLAINSSKIFKNTNYQALLTPLFL